MNKLLLSSFLAASLIAPAFAGEGAGDPFPLSAPGQIETAAPQGFDVGQAQLPNLPQAYSFAFNGMPTTEPTSREAEVVTANSLPRNALVGTVEYAQQQSVARWFASHPGLRDVAYARTHAQTQTQTGG